LHTYVPAEFDTSAGTPASPSAATSALRGRVEKYATGPSGTIGSSRGRFPQHDHGVGAESVERCDEEARGLEPENGQLDGDDVSSRDALGRNAPRDLGRRVDRVRAKGFEGGQEYSHIGGCGMEVGAVIVGRRVFTTNWPQVPTPGTPPTPSPMT
jgi:hypothetical protein